MIHITLTAMFQAQQFDKGVGVRFDKRTLPFTLAGLLYAASVNFFLSLTGATGGD